MGSSVAEGSVVEEYTEYGFVFYSQDNDFLSHSNNLFKEGLDDKKLSKKIEYRLDVIERFKKMVPNFGEWLLKQTNDGYLYGRRLDFIKDILKFVNTGRRDVSVNAWEILLAPINVNGITDLNSTDVRKKPLEDLKDIGRKTPIPDTNSLIIKWCSMDGGFDDMLWSLKTMTSWDGYHSKTPINDSSFKINF